MPYQTGGTPAPNRRSQIRKALGPKREFFPGKLPPRRFPNTIAPMPGSPQAPARGNQGIVPRRGVGVGQSNQAGLGQQLTNRVNSGRISQGQAEDTARQRQTLKAAFGSDWRNQVFGKGGAKGLEGQPFGGPNVAARRAKALARARAKLQGNVGPGAAA